jgi:hypothetical protein
MTALAFGQMQEITKTGFDPATPAFRTRSPIAIVLAVGMDGVDDFE